MTKGMEEVKTNNILEDMKQMYGDTDLANPRKLGQSPVVGESQEATHFCAIETPREPGTGGTKCLQSWRLVSRSKAL